MRLGSAEQLTNIRRIINSKWVDGPAYKSPRAVYSIEDLIPNFDYSKIPGTGATE